jgi:hypothetical protein
MKAGVSGGMTQPFLNSEVDGSALSASHSSCFIPRERSSSTHCIGDWVGPELVCTGCWIKFICTKLCDNTSNVFFVRLHPSVWSETFIKLKCFQNINLVLLKHVVKSINFHEHSERNVWMNFTYSIRKSVLNTGTRGHRYFLICLRNEIQYSTFLIGYITSKNFILWISLRI